MAPFDPYHKWLGIPPAEQPASYYRLLGIAEFEADPDVIDGAAEQRTIYLRTFQTGPNAEVAEGLLNEVSAARVCLLNAEDKSRYDQQLQVGAEHSRLKDVATATPERVIPRQEKARPLASEDEVAVPVEPVAAEDSSTQERDWTFATVKLPDDKDRRLVEPEQLPPLDTDPLAGFPADLAPYADNVNDLKRSLGNRRKTFWQEPWAVPAAAGGVVAVVLLMMLVTSWIGRIGDSHNGTVTSQQDEDQQATAAAERAAAEKRAAEFAREDQAANEREAAFLAVARRRGNRYLANKEYGKAIADFTEAIRINPDDALAYNNRGYAYIEKKEHDKAIADFTEAIRINPDDALAYRYRGSAYNRKKEHDKAIADNTEAIRLEPDDAAGYVNRGASYCQKKEYDKAIADCNEAIRINPDYFGAYNNRGIAYSGMGEYDKAIADYTEVIRINPDNALAYHYRGSAYNRKNEHDKAIADYKEAIRIDPSDALAHKNLAIGHLNRGVAYSGIGDQFGAIADYMEAIRIDPNYAKAYHNLGVMYSNMGFKAQAKAAYDKAKELGYEPK